MSFKDTNNTEENPLPNNEIKTILLNVYEKLTKPSTKEVGYELFLKLILKHLYNPPSIAYIISQLAEFIPPLPPKEKEPTLNLLSLIFFDPNSNPENPKKKTIYFQYLSLVLSIIQNIISDKNNSIFGLIANTFAEIVQNIMPTDINYALEEIDIEERKAYETLQGFCLYNMKQEEKVNRIVGSLCLTKLVENCPVVLQEKYMKLIWENIIHLIEMKNYTAKYELLNCLISLILGAENLFMPFANTTLYKVLDFLSEEDSNKRKLALNVIYTLIFYCKEEILPLKDHIVNFLKVLKTDKVKEVREVCLLILQIFNENEPKKKEKEKSIGAIINTKNKGNKNNLGKKENENKSKNKSRPKTGNKMKKNNKFFENNKKFEKNPFKDNSFDNTNYNKKPSNNINNANTTNINNNENPGDENIIKTNEFQKKLNNETNTVETITGATSNQNKIKGKKSNNFVNEKMIIKPDPNKSIFKAVPNSAFFNQGNQNNKDIVVMAKKKPAKINEINKNNNIIKEENNEKNEIINQNQEIKNEYKKDINKKKPKEDLRYKNIFNNDDDNNFNEEINNNKYENGEEDNIIINEESNNNINNIIDCDERPKQKNSYEKDNKYKKENVGNSNNNIIQKLLNQMDFLTKGQNSLEKMFNNIQLDTQEQIDNLNINYENLQIKTNKLNKDFDNFNLNVY